MKSSDEQRRELRWQRQRRRSSRTSSTARWSTRPRGRPRTSSTRPPARRSPRRRSRPRRTSTAPSPRRGTPSRAGRRTPPSERARALLRIADLIEERAEEIADLESADAGKPRGAVVEDEIPLMADNLRFFAGAARCLEGRAAGEYMEGYTSIIRREPVGVVGQITPWNYPLMMAVWKIGPALGGRQHDRAQAGRDDPGDDAEVRRVVRRHPAARRLQRDRRPRRAGRRGAGHPPRRRHGLADRLAADRQVDRRGRRRHAQAGPPRARRQGAGGRLRRRRDGDRDGDDRRHRLLQRRPGLHRGDPGAGRQGRLRRRRQRPREQAKGLVLGDTPRRGHDAGPAQLRAPARARRGLPRAQARATPRSSPAARSPTCPASSSSRRSSPGSSRATR